MRSIITISIGSRLIWSLCYPNTSSNLHKQLAAEVKQHLDRFKMNFPEFEMTLYVLDIHCPSIPKGGHDTSIQGKLSGRCQDELRMTLNVISREIARMITTYNARHGGPVTINRMIRPVIKPVTAPAAIQPAAKEKFEEEEHPYFDFYEASEDRYYDGYLDDNHNEPDI